MQLLVNYKEGGISSMPVRFIDGDTIEPFMFKELEDVVNKPNHYHKNEIDVNGVLEKHFPRTPNVTVYEGFLIGNIIKYVCRHKEKNGVQDLEKAIANIKLLMELSAKEEP
jgi:hypothetical protein